MCGCCIGIQLNWNYWDTVLRLVIRKIVSHKFQCWCWRSCQQTICLVRFHNHWFLRCFSKSNYCFSISIIKKRYLCSSKRIKIFSFSSLCYFQTWGILRSKISYHCLKIQRSGFSNSGELGIHDISLYSRFYLVTLWGNWVHITYCVSRRITNERTLVLHQGASSLEEPWQLIKKFWKRKKKTHFLICTC